MDIAKKLHDLFSESKLQGDTVIFPAWNITVLPRIETIDAIKALDKKSVEISFRISSPNFDQEIYEYQVGFAENQDTAISLALGSFAIGMMSGIKQMMKAMGHSCGGCTCDISGTPITSEYAGEKHNWMLYKSDVVNMGSELKNEFTIDSFSEIIMDDVAKRLGNHKLAYVKIFAAKMNDNITGQCFINHVISPELSQKIADYVSTWEVDGYASQKQFFFILQDDDTYTTFPHTLQDISKFTNTAIDMFDACTTEDELNHFPERLTEAIGDRNLAEELYMFIPEMCAEKVFYQLDYGENVFIDTNGEQQVVYKNQIYSYYPILSALHSRFNTNFSKELYNKYVKTSSIISVVNKAMNEGTDWREGGKSSITYFPSDGYSFR